ncbi:MAG: hypothetical protein JWM27_98 [Gemmatimonadetes bacterium]|nr:hypothetical protein [Gemmatimonadota bacterium]
MPLKISITGYTAADAGDESTAACVEVVLSPRPPDAWWAAIPQAVDRVSYDADTATRVPGTDRLRIVAPLGGMASVLRRLPTLLTLTSHKYEMGADQCTGEGAARDDALRLVLVAAGIRPAVEEAASEGGDEPIFWQPGDWLAFPATARAACAGVVARLRQQVCDIADVDPATPEGDLVMRGVSVTCHLLTAGVLIYAPPRTSPPHVHP